MTPVFFNGYGEWFITDCFGNSHPINQFGGYFMMPKEDVDHCIRWQLHDVFRNYYDRLGPIHVAGDFKLTDDDERRYLDRKSILINSGFSLGQNELEFVEKLLPIYPVDDIDCEFTRFARRHGISVNDYYRCYFKIAKRDMSDDSNNKNLNFMLYEFELPTFCSKKSTEFESTKVERDSLPTETNSTNKDKISKNDKRIESLKEFIKWLEVRIEIDRQNLDCTKKELFDFLKSWEKDRETQKNNRVWNVCDWESCGDLWGSEKRKQVCDIADDRRGRKIESPYKKLFS
ncbi:hypothetical protein ACQE3D_09640 [Methylomonas sp. MS20]|uniref:hypothetical protein n=1 Tax=unclassified Methylomonas TaxID=2608980 RepID=UPI0028A4B74A|nr:hypothetical protein [Methylomonas sp. MV1]MDT4328739.1 hypothetical protein [Methylomonas sp. MV1]